MLVGRGPAERPGYRMVPRPEKGVGILALSNCQRQKRIHRAYWDLMHQGRPIEAGMLWQRWLEWLGRRQHGRSPAKR